MTAKKAVKKQLVGRPPLPVGKARRHILPVRFTPSEIKVLREQAKGKKVSVSEYVRQHLSKNHTPVISRVTGTYKSRKRAKSAKVEAKAKAVA